MFSYREPMGYRIKHALYMYFEEVRQVVVPLGRQTTITLFGRVNQNVASGVKSGIYDFLVVSCFWKHARGAVLCSDKPIKITRIYCIWLGSTVVERRSLAAELSLSTCS